MAVTIESARASVTELYIAAFNRVPDAAGLAYWTNLVVNGTLTVSQVAQTFTGTPEYQAKYPTFLTNGEYVDKIYLNVFGRAADPGGKAFWTATLDNNQLTWGTIMDEMLKSAHLDPANPDGIRLDNQATFGVWCATNGIDTNLGTSFLPTVTADPASVTTAETNVSASSGQTYVLTTGVDNRIGTIHNDIFDGSLGGANGATMTLNSSDTLDGAAGTDTLNAVINAATVVQPTLKNIEKIAVQFTTAGPGELSLLNATGVTSVENTTSSAAGKISNIGSTSVALKNSSTNQNIEYAFTAAAVAGTADTANLELSTVTGGTITVAGIETLNIASAGSANTVGTLTAAAATKLVISGDKALTITTDLGTTVATVDGGAATGAITLQTTKGTEKITGGSGNDVFTLKTTAGAASVSAGGGDDTIIFDGLQTLTDADTVDGGAGTNTLKALSAGFGGLTTAHKISNIQTIEVTDAQAHAYNLATIGAGVNKLVLASNKSTDGITFNAGASILELQGTTFDDATYTATGTGTADALTISVKANLTNDKDIITSGFETLTISNSTAAEVYDDITMNSGNADTTVNFVGSQNVDTDVITAKIINASGLTGTARFSNTSDATVGATSITGSANGDNITGSTTATSIDGGAGNDTITGGAGNDTILGGAGDDQITTNAGADSVDAGAGNDLITVDGNLTAADTISGGDGNDTLSITTLTDPAGLANVTNVEVIQVTGASTTVALSAPLAAASTFDFSTASVQKLYLLNGYTGDTTVILTGDTNVSDEIYNQANVTMNVVAEVANVKGTTIISGGTGTDTLTLTADSQAAGAVLTNVSGVDSIIIRQNTTTATHDAVLDFNNTEAVVGSGKTMVIDATNLTNTGATLKMQNITETNGFFSVTGGAGGDTLVGGSLADTILGGGGADDIDGGAGNDNLMGEAGDDTITAGAGNDSINGGAGNDKIVMATNLTNADSIDGGDGTADVLTATVTSLTATTGAVRIANVETLNLTNAGSATIDATNITGATVINGFGAAAATTITNLAAGVKVGIGEKGAATALTGTTTVSLASATGTADTLTFNIQNTGAQTATLAAENIETITLALDSEINGAQALTVSGVKATTLNVTGGTNGNDDTVTLTGVSTSTTKVDASTSTAKLDIAAAASHTAALEVNLKGTTASKVDLGNVSGQAKVVVSSMGTQNHTLVGGGGTTDILTVNEVTGAIDSNDWSAFETINLAIATTTIATPSDVTGLNTATTVNVTGGNTLSQFKMPTATALSTSTTKTFDASGFNGITEIEGTADSINKAVTVKGGSGSSDSLTAKWNTAANDYAPTISGFETVKLQLDSGGDGAEAYTVDMSGITGASTLLAIDIHASGDSAALTKLSQTQTYQLGGAGLTDGYAGTALTATLNSATGTADVLNLKLTDTNDAANTLAITSAGTEILNLAVADAAQNHKLDLSAVTPTAGSSTTVNVTTGKAGQSLTLTNTGTATSVIDANGFAGDLVMTGRGASTAMTITTGSGADTIIMKHANDVLNSGTGTDTLKIQAALVLGGVQIDLSSTVDQVTTYNGSANAAIQKGFENVDLSGLTGAGADITAISTGSTIIATSNTDVITGGAGADIITAGAGADYISGGAGSNVFIFAPGSLGAIPTTTVFDTIADWTAGTNKIDFGATNITVDAGTGSGLTLNANGLVTAGAASLAAYVTALGNSTTAVAGSAIIYSDGTSSYLFISDGVAGLGIDDTFIKIAGVNAATGFTLTGGDITAIA